MHLYRLVRDVVARLRWMMQFEHSSDMKIKCTETYASFMILKSNFESLHECTRGKWFGILDPILYDASIYTELYGKLLTASVKSFGIVTTVAGCSAW